MRSIRRAALRIAAFAFTASGVPSLVDAQTITFNNLAGSNGTAFSAYSESGFDVTLLVGDLCVAKFFGNPIPALYDGGGCGTDNVFALVSVTRSGGGLFRWLGIDLAAVDGGTIQYSVEGGAPGASLYQQTGTFASTTFFTLASNNSSTAVNELRFSIGSVNARSFNIDNIALGAATTVPEPSSFALIGLGLTAVIAARRRKTAR